MGERTRRARQAAPSALIALLLVASVVTPFATGLASAQTYEKTVSDSPGKVVLDTSEMSAGTFTLEVVVSPSPGGGTDVIYREEHQVAGADDKMIFDNAQAYENVTFRVSGVDSEPDMGAIENFGQIIYSKDQVFLTTSGDRGYKCDLGERLYTAANPYIQSSDCSYVLPGTTSVNSTGLDANETKLEIYQSAATQADSADNYHTMLNNRLQDTETVSLIKAKGAYIRALNAGEGETAARAAGTNNITEYYSTMEVNHIAEWEAQVSNIQYLSSLAANETGVPSDYVYVEGNWTHTGGGAEFEIHPNWVGTTQESYTLQNGTTVQVTNARVEFHVYDVGSATWHNSTVSIGPSTGAPKKTFFNGDDITTLEGVSVAPPTSNYEKQPVMDFREYASHTSSIDSQTRSAIGQMDTVVNQTYSEYQQGQINSSDLVDPYVLQNQFSPGDEYQGWSAATLALLGTNQPTDLDQTGYMKVNVSGGETVKGILQAGGNPPGGEFVVGQTYDPANVTGSVFVTTDSRVIEVEKPFTLENATTYDGQVRTNVTIEKKTYNTTSADDLKALNEELSLLREEISAREDNMNGGTGGGGLLGGSSQGVVLLIAGAAVVVVVLGNGGRR